MKLNESSSSWTKIPQQNESKGKQQERGVYKLIIKRIQINQQYTEISESNKSYLNIRLGQQLYQQSLTRNQETNQLTINNSLFLFERKAEQTLIIFTSQEEIKRANDEDDKQKLLSQENLLPLQLASKAQQSMNIQEKTANCSYAQLFLLPFVLMKETQHRVNIHLVERTPEKQIIKKQAGRIELLIYYIPKFSSEIEIQIIRGNLQRDTSSFGKMNISVMISVGGKSQKIPSVTGGGLKPHWKSEDTKVFTISSPLDKINIQIINQDHLLIDKAVGSAVIDWRILGLNALQQFTQIQEQLFYLDTQKKIAGSITFRLKLTIKKQTYQTE